MSRHFIVVILFIRFLTATAWAQFDFTQAEPDGSRYIGGPRLGKSQNQVWRAGIILEPGTALNNAQISIPVPMDWREQRVVSINEEKMGAHLANRVGYQIINDGALEMRVHLGPTRPAKPLEIVVAFELQNYELLPPDEPSQHVIPKQVPPEIRQYLKESPTIESNDPRFKKMYADITKDRRTDWDKVEALYSFVQNNVKYNAAAWKEPAKGALSVIKMPKGEWTADCKDMTCLFVALCRAGKIPARVVRVPEHCYAEFYLELKQTNRTSSNRRDTPPGFWFPCQVSGTYSFGGIPETRVILQKGDSFPEPDNPGVNTLFMTECFQGALLPGSPQPEFQWVHAAEVK